jgi:3-deoxy-D-manno-octulosonate 8-phosphate phosphatase (KDO 8-P phosphatase)
MPEAQDQVRARARPVQLLCLDVDGVLTDGQLYWSPGGVWSQRFSVRDGYGIRRLQEAGVQIALLSAGDLPSARDRARSLSIERAYFAVTDKLRAWSTLADALGVTAEQTAFIGDELSDLPLLRTVGLAATVPDAVAEVQAAVHYITRCPGGNGAVREVCDLILRERGDSP